MRRLLSCILLAVLLWACHDTTFVSAVPSRYVHLELNIAAEYPHFRPTGAFQAYTFTETRYPTDAIGYAGVVVWTAMDEHYYAADLCCPHCLRQNQPVEIDGIFARCPVCGEEYDLSWGYCVPTKHISKEALRRYHTSYSGDRLLIYDR